MPNRTNLRLPVKFAGPRQLGEIIRLARKARGFTQSRVAGMTGTSVKFVSEVENGKETAQIGMVLRLVAILDLGTEIFNLGAPLEPEEKEYEES